MHTNRHVSPTASKALVMDFLKEVHDLRVEELPGMDFLVDNNRIKFIFSPRLDKDGGFHLLATDLLLRVPDEGNCQYLLAYNPARQVCIKVSVDALRKSLTFNPYNPDASFFLTIGFLKSLSGGEYKAFSLSAYVGKLKLREKRQQEHEDFFKRLTPLRTNKTWKLPTAIITQS